MTEPAPAPPPPPPQAPPPVVAQDGLSTAQTAALVVAGVLAVDAVWRVLPARILIADVGPWTARLIAAVLARAVVVGMARAAAVAGAAVAHLTGRPPLVVTVAAADLARLERAAGTLVDRVPDTGVRPPPPRPEDRVALAALEVRAARLAAEADAADVARAEAELREAEDELAALDAADEAADAAELARLRAELRRMDRRDADRYRRARAYVEQAEREEADRLARLAEQERQWEAEAAERDARRAAEEARLRRLAETEAARAADRELGAQLADSDEWPGWIRAMSADACDTCKAWGRGPDHGLQPVRPWSVEMKRHPSCSCLRAPVSRSQMEELGREFSTEREPVAPRWKRRRDRDDDRPADDGGGDAGG